MAFLDQIILQDARRCPIQVGLQRVAGRVIEMCYGLRKSSQLLHKGIIGNFLRPKRIDLLSELVSDAVAISVNQSNE